MLNFTRKSTIFILCFCVYQSCGVEIKVVNNCNYTVWPGILGNSGHPSLKYGGFHLGSGEKVVIEVFDGWSGKIWGRQGCCFNEHGLGRCDSGDCDGLLHCNGTGGTPPATVVEMTFGTPKSQLHYYDVTLVEGFNIPVSMAPIGGGEGCGVASCEKNLNVCCPSRFVVMSKNGDVVGCQSACLALKTDKYCCTGEYASSSSCKPTLFSHLFKSLCPNAYSFAYDNDASLKTCKVEQYVLAFCPST